MERRYFSQLSEWIRHRDRKPLILRGARQVGKSTLVRLFAQAMGLDLLEVNLEKTKFHCLEQTHFRIEDWEAEIEFSCQKKLTTRSLIFLDEIQAQPKAITFLRYFYEERPERMVLTAGSLLEIALHQNEISFPVGRVSYLWVSPMTFSEFLKANHQDQLCEMVLTGNIPEFAHQPLLEEVKKYFFIGGMPKAVSTYIETRSMLEVRTVQNEILESYSNDFPKYERRASVEKLGSIFRSIPFHLGKKLIYQKMDPQLRSGEIKKCLQLFQQAHIITPCYHSSVSGLPLRSSVDESVFKIYFLDLGLVNATHGFSWSEFNSYFNESFVTKGFLAEQFVAQHLSYNRISFSGPEALFWLKDKTLGKAEIDFIISAKKGIFPIEVRAESGGRLKSFQVFAKEKSNIVPPIEVGIKFSKSYFFTEKVGPLRIHNWPYYAIEGFLNQLASEEESEFAPATKYFVAVSLLGSNPTEGQEEGTRKELFRLA